MATKGALVALLLIATLTFCIGIGIDKFSLTGWAVAEGNFSTNDTGLLDITAMQNETAPVANIAPEVLQALDENESVPVAIVVETKKSAEISAAKTSITDTLEDTSADLQYFPEAKAYGAEVTKEQVDQLGQIEGIKIEIQKEFQLDLSASVPYINATKVWPIVIGGQNITGKDITVCIIDTGVAYTHVALGSCLGSSCKVLGGYDFVNSDSDPMDDNGHGTHVAGIIASTDSTYKGVAPEASLVAVKSFTSGGSASSQDIANGIKWCKDHKTEFDISVVSMSFGDGGSYSASNCPDDALINPELSAAHSAGLVLIASAGNTYSANGISYPACNSNVVAIGATGRSNDAVQSFSKSGNALDLWAPGASITSTGLAGDFVTLSGTSMAAPHVAGMAALVLQYNKLKYGTTLTPAEVESRMKSTGVSVTDSRNSITRSRIDAAAAISPVITIESPQNTSYGVGLLDFNMTVDNGITAATVTVNNNSYGLANNSATHWYNVTIPALPEGQYDATFYAISDFNSSKTVSFSVYANCTAAPSIVLESPANNSNISRGNVLNFTITDDIAGVDIVLAEFNGTNSTLASPYDYSTANWTKGLQNMIIFANNTAGLTNSSFFAFNVYNSAPVFASQPNANYTTLVTKPVTITVNATDPDGDAISYSTATNISSSWSNTTSSGALTWSWTPNSTESGAYYLRFTANDGTASTIANTNIIVRGNNAPVLSSISNQTAKAGTQKTIDFIASDADISYGDSLTWSDNTSLFSITKVNSTNARAVFTPTSSQADVYYVNITVTDVVGAKASGVFMLTISSNTTASSGDDGGGGAGGLLDESDYDQTKTFSTISANTPVSFSPGVADLNVNSIILETNANVSNVTLKIRKLDSAAVAAPGEAEQYFELIATNLTNAKIKSVTTQFSVPKTWLTQNSFNKSDVYLGYLSGTTWSKLPVSVIEENASIVKYNATTNHFSIFAIAASKPINTTASANSNGTGKSLTLTNVAGSATVATKEAKFARIFAFLMLGLIALLMVLYFRPKKPLNIFSNKTKQARPERTRSVPDFGF